MVVYYTSSDVTNYDFYELNHMNGICLKVLPATPDHWICDVLLARFYLDDTPGVSFVRVLRKLTEHRHILRTSLIPKFC